MSEMIVEPKPGVFTFVGKDGDSLRDVVMELNDQWSFYLVRRVGDDAQLKGLEKTLEDVEENGVDRGTMVTVESMGLGQLNDLYPASSYTLKRSNTNRKVAMEEISTRIKDVLVKMYKHILALISKGAAYLKEKCSAVKQKFKRDAAKDLGDKVIVTFNTSEYLTAAEIKQDPKLSANAAALEEHYSVLVNKLITEATFMQSFQTLVEDFDKLVNPLAEKVETVKQATTAIKTGNTAFTFSALKEIEKKPLPNDFQLFLRQLSLDSSIKETAPLITAAQNELLHLASEVAPLDPYSLAKLNMLVMQAARLVTGDHPKFVFDDTTLEKALLGVLSDVESLQKDEKAIFNALNDDVSNTGSLLRNALNSIYQDTMILRFVVDFADRFFTLVATFIRNTSLYLEHCKK